MAGPFLWLAIYLTVGVAVLWVCYNTGACLVRSRLERNARVLGLLAARPADDERATPLSAAPAKAFCRRPREPLAP